MAERHAPISHEGKVDFNERDFLRVGDMLYGFCGGYFGRDSYADKRVEAIGADWVVVRDEHGEVGCFTGNQRLLLEYRNPPPEEDDETWLGPDGWTTPPPRTPPSLRRT